MKICSTIVVVLLLILIGFFLYYAIKSWLNNFVGKIRFYLTGNPFTIKGWIVSYCFHCSGWGNDPTGDRCQYCKGQGFKRLAAGTMSSRSM